MTQLNILNLGAGVQSTRVYMMALDGELPIDYAIFADVGEEPTPVYEHLRWMQSLNGPPILVKSKGRLGDDLRTGINGAGKRFASIPTFTAPDGATRAKGMTRRQCTREYKIEVIEKAIRYDILGLKPRQRMPKDVHVTNYIGISTDEEGRSTKVKERFSKSKWQTCKFPLIDLGISRQDCLDWLAGRVPHVVPRSSCVFCPFHKDEEWIWLKQNDPAGWARAVEIDEALRTPGNLVNRGLDQKLYLHRSVKPLIQIEFKPSPFELGIEVLECDGMCGA